MKIRSSYPVSHIALLILFVYGLSASAGIVVFNSVVQQVVPDAVRGRVFTLLDVTWHAMRLLSLGLGGLMVDLVGIEPVFWGENEIGRFTTAPVSP